MKLGFRQGGWKWQRKQPSAFGRRGSALMIVVVLLGLLSLLGVLFYTFSAQERENADYFAQSAKETPPSEELFDFGLEQLIVGAPNYLPQSALWGRRHSIVANMVGRLDPRTGRPRDLSPFDGTGVHVIDAGGGQPAVDQNYDGNPDNAPSLAQLLEFNDSPAAWGALNPRKPVRPNFAGLPAPDVGYTYPDINCLFLAFNGYGLDSTGNPVRVIIPSFHRPQYLRVGGTVVADWYKNAQLTGRVFRPHPLHVAFDSRGHVVVDANGQPVRRFISSPTDPDLALQVAGSGPFPFASDLDGDGTPGEMGIWTRAISGGATEYDLDVDNDGDGIYEGVWLDLGFPAQEDPATGAKYVPLFSFTVYDADGLVNLNIHGNLNGNVDLASARFGNGRFVSTSNLGLSPAEVNPERALTGDPGSAGPNVFDQHQRFFGHRPADRVEAANMEWWFLNVGRPEYDSSGNVQDLFAGRWGDLNYLYGAIQGQDPNGDGNTDASDFPRPGRWNLDDNGDAFEGGARRAGPGMPELPPFVQPLDYSASGRFTRPGTFGKQPLLLPVFGATNPSVWLAYLGYGLAGDVLLHQQVPSLMPGLRAPNLTSPGVPPTWLLDDPMELTVEPNRADRPHDEPFTAEEMAFLHLTNEDVSANNVTGRLEKLIPFNFAADSSSNPAGEQIRDRFTTLSWDRKEPAHPSVWLFGADGEPGQAGVDDDQDGQTDRLLDGRPDWGEVGAVGSDDFRGWEFSADSDYYVDQQSNKLVFSPDGRPEFPPQFGGPGADGQPGTSDDPVPVWGPTDPFRPVLRRLLTIELGQTRPDQFRPLARLSLNGVLDVVRRPNRKPNELTDRLVFRPLTPHPTDPNNPLGPQSISLWARGGNANSPYTIPPYPPTTLEAQEWWARYDRQRMARDIYVLLYTLGGGDDTKDYARMSNARAGGTGPRPLYTDAQLREMAQFAVNLVDALDPDDVITKFEYDKDLSNGWNLDDDPFSWQGEPAPLQPTDPLYNPAFPEDAGDRGVVYGVEMQQLTFSEVLVIKADQVKDQNNNPVDHPGTEYIDTKDRYFTYIELRNASPFRITFGQGGLWPRNASGLWEIEAQPEPDTTNGETLDQAIQRRRRLILRWGSVGPGELFTIGSTGDADTLPVSGNQRLPSLFRVDPNWAPNSTPNPLTIAPKAGSLNLDLIPSDNQVPDLSNEMRFRLAKSPDRTGDPRLWLFGDGPRTDIIGDFVRGGVVGDEDVNHNGVIDGAEDVNGNGQLDNWPLKLNFVLKRRLNPYRIPPVENNGANTNDHAEQSQDNPWVEVDRIGAQINLAGSDPDIVGANPAAIDPDLAMYAALEAKEFQLTQDEPGSSYSAKLQTLESTEREQPLSRVVQPGRPLPNTDIRANSLGFNNVAGPKPFTLWQPHFDRDFASTAELLSLPLYGPRFVNRMLSPSGINTAGVQKFLRPQHDEDVNGNGTVDGWEDRNGNNALDAGDPQFSNRWYRLLEFVEVPTRTHRQLGDPLKLKRVPGKINLNTIRHPEVLAALLDDEDVFSVDNDVDQNTGRNNVFLQDRAESARDWWIKFLLARDGVRDANNPGQVGLDPITNALLPGVPGTEPFRALSFVAPVSTPQQAGNLTEHTWLRLLPGLWQPPQPPQAPDGRQLFELGTEAEHRNGDIDHYTRNRLLSKIWNNVTTRSNVFYVFMTVQGFEAVEVVPDPSQPNVKAVRIGGPLKDANGDYVLNQRGFFVIDRSNIEEAYDPTTGQFNWRALVKYRLRLE